MDTKGDPRDLYYPFLVRRRGFLQWYIMDSSPHTRSSRRWSLNATWGRCRRRGPYSSLTLRYRFDLFMKVLTSPDQLLEHAHLFAILGQKIDSSRGGQIRLLRYFEGELPSIQIIDTQIT